MNQRIEMQIHEEKPYIEPVHEAESVRHRLIREEREDAKNRYSPKMSDAEIEAFIARQHQQADAWAREQNELTDSVPIIRRMRTQRTRHLLRQGDNAHRG